MNAAMDGLVLFLGMIVAVWVFGFGLTGAACSRSAGVGSGAGFAVGALLGPIGLMWLWWRARNHAGDNAADPFDSGTHDLDIPF